MLFEQAGQIAVGENALKPAVSVHNKNRPGPAVAASQPLQRLADRFRPDRQTQLFSLTHDVRDRGQHPPQTSAGMKDAELSRRELFHATDDESQRIAHRQHRGCACRGSQPQFTGFVHPPQFDNNTGRSSQRTARFRGDRDDHRVQVTHQRQQSAHFFSFAAVRNGDHDIRFMHTSQIAVNRFGRVQKMGSRSG